MNVSCAGFGSRQPALTDSTATNGPWFVRRNASAWRSKGPLNLLRWTPNARPPFPRAGRTVVKLRQ
jgi:hypothetical protein